MKKFALALVCIAGFALSGQAQEISNNAIGIRFGGGNGFGAEATYQHNLGGANNRLELDLGFRNDNDFDAFKLAALYQWVWNIDGGFNWYVGAGGGVGSVSDNHHWHDDHHHKDGAFGFIAGNIGVEYNFDIPLMVFIDFRPEIGFADYDVIDNFAPDLAIGARFQF